MPDYTGGQFPSLDGDEEAEVAQRTEPGTDGSWFRHVFTLHNRHHTVGLPVEHEVHRSNFVAVLQRALQQGLHPKAQPELESEEPHPTDPSHTNVTYRVRVVPAVADHDPYTTVTPSNPGGGPDGRPDVQESEVDPRWTRGETGEPPAAEPHAGGGGVESGPVEQEDSGHRPGADHDHSGEAAPAPAPDPEA